MKKLIIGLVAGAIVLGITGLSIFMCIDSREEPYYPTYVYAKVNECVEIDYGKGFYGEIETVTYDPKYTTMTYRVYDIAGNEVGYYKHWWKYNE